MATGVDAMRSGHRFPEDDFFCEKYGVWYALRDCNYRVLGRTYEGCVQCFQGRVNLRRVRTAPSAPVAGNGDVLQFPRRRPEAAEAARVHRALPPEVPPR